MISGFNTDIECDGVVYHVQTEDKGTPARKIISLVYDRGTILASKRLSYDEISEDEPEEQQISETLSRQHKLICAAVKAGRIGDLKEMTAKASRSAKAAVEAVPLAIEPAIVLSEPAIAHVDSVIAHAEPAVVQMAPSINVELLQPSIAAVVTEAVEVAEHEHVTDLAQFSIPKPAVTPPSAADPFFDAPLFEDVSIIEEDDILPAEAVAVVSELSGRDRPANTRLSIELLGDAKFKGGDRLTVSFLICRGTDRKVVAGAQVMIKVLGSSFRPVIFHAKSDANGLAKVHLQLPHFSAGRAALLIRAMSEGEEIELRRIVTPG